MNFYEPDLELNIVDETLHLQAHLQHETTIKIIADLTEFLFEKK